MKKLLIGIAFFVGSLSTLAQASKGEIQYFMSQGNPLEKRYVEFDGENCLSFITYSDTRTSIFVKQSCTADSMGGVKATKRPSIAKFCNYDPGMMQQRQSQCIMNCGNSLSNIGHSILEFTKRTLDSAKEYEKVKWKKKNYRKYGLIHNQDQNSLIEVSKNYMLNGSTYNVLSKVLNNYNLECTDIYHKASRME